MVVRLCNSNAGSEVQGAAWPVPCPMGLPQAHCRNCLRSYRCFRLLGNSDYAAAGSRGNGNEDDGNAALAANISARQGGTIVACAGEWELFGTLLEDPVQLAARHDS